MNLAESLRFWATWRPSGCALILGGKRYSWEEIHAASNQLGAGFRSVGVSKGDRIAILASNNVFWYHVVFAALKLGAIVVPVNVRLAAPEVNTILSLADCKVVVTDDDHIATLMKIPGVSERSMVVSFGHERPEGVMGLDELYSLRAENNWPEVEADDPAIIPFTSGTTGIPKGAVLTHGNILAFSRMFFGPEQWTSETRYLQVGSFSYTGGIIHGILLTTIAGATLYVESTFNPTNVLHLLQEEAITAWHGVPVLWTELAREEGFAEAHFPQLKGTITGGSPVSEHLIRTIAARGIVLRQCYGLTESGTTATIATPELSSTDPRSAGYPLMHVDLRIVNDHYEAVATGESGEILIKSPASMKEYWRNPFGTSETLVDGWLRTGDIGRLGPDGQLYVLDRKKDMLISGGLNIYPAEVEMVVGAFPGVLEVSVIGTSDPRWGESVVAVLRSVEAIDDRELLAHCRERLADYKVPRYVIRVDEPLPRSLTGKVLRREVMSVHARVSETQSPIR